MRHFIAIGSTGGLCILLGLGFVLSRKAKAAIEPGILFSQVNQLVTGWEAQKVPENGRAVNIVVDDGDIGELVNKLSGKPVSSESIYDAETLPLKRSGFTAWFKRTFLRRSMSVEKLGPLAESFSKNSNTITWTHKGNETASEEEMTREFMKAILAAHDSGAEVNIVTRGIAALPA